MPLADEKNDSIHCACTLLREWFEGMAATTHTMVVSAQALSGKLHLSARSPITLNYSPELLTVIRGPAPRSRRLTCRAIRWPALSPSPAGARTKMLGQSRGASVSESRLTVTRGSGQGALPNGIGGRAGSLVSRSARCKRSWRNYMYKPKIFLVK